MEQEPDVNSWERAELSTVVGEVLQVKASIFEGNWHYFDIRKKQLERKDLKNLGDKLRSSKFGYCLFKDKLYYIRNGAIQVKVMEKKKHIKKLIETERIRVIDRKRQIRFMKKTIKLNQNLSEDIKPKKVVSGNGFKNAEDMMSFFGK